MKLKGLLILFFALIFWTDLAANEGEPKDYSPFEKLFEWYEPLLLNTPDLPNAHEDFSEDKIRGLYRELKTDLHVAMNSVVFDYIRHYTTGQKSNFEVALSLESLYGTDILNKVVEAGLPREVAFLPLSLSGMHNQAINQNGGSGLWSMNYYVAIKYGLEVSSYIDERKDPEKSTEVAIVYLKELYNKYKSWNLAITAFATSPALVNKAIIHSGNKTNYWEVAEHLPVEAKNVIPSFFASIFVASFYPELDLNPPGILINQQKEPIELKEEVSLSVLSKELKVKEQTLRLLNPTFRGGTIAPKSKSGIDFFIPQGFAVQLTKVEKNLYSETKKINKPKRVIPPKPEIKIPAGTQKITYVVQSGDYLGRIAEKHRVRVSHIKRWNYMRSDRINIGQRLTLYVNPSIAKNAASKPKVKKAAPKKTVSPDKLMNYTVKDGDTLWEIVKNNPGNDIETIQQINNISASIKPGQVIKIIKP